ncbi:hypothetical protein MANES_02G199200v8 [Manihot esculenta]|uniref:Uncharacterized protein n=1 Tax=Manihot esculenta TaxID=3983 RepID=A0ACB7I709_MANES|nr:hypothetical protein MANES_02G199200v8 [Manihot esculenta]
MTESKRMANGVALNFPANEEETTSSSLSPPLKAPPRRLRSRLLAEPKTPLSAEDIEAKLREANLRRQAKRQRAEHLRQRRNLSCHLHDNSKMIHEQEYLARKLARYWRRFVKLKKTTFSLAKAYRSLGINEESVKAMPFEQLALLIKSTATINTTKALVDRLESRLRLLWAIRGCQPSLANIDHLLRIAVVQNYTGSSSNNTQRGAKTTKSVKEEAQMPVTLSRYPVRVVLCAYMIMGHPDAVLNGQGECEVTLLESAVRFIREFELLLKIIIDGPIKTSQEEIASEIPSQKTFRFQLEAFDKAWCFYLHHFVSWKLKDAKLLEEDLVRAACQLEFSMMQSKLTLGDDGTLANDMEAIKKQVLDEQKLLREKVQHLSGNTGLKRMECALTEIRSKFIGDEESKSPLKSSSGQISSSCPPHSLEGSSVTNSSAKRIIDDHQSVDTLLVSENELLVNEIVHEYHRGLADTFNAADKDPNNVQEKVRETMERAFWDCVMESVKQDEPDFSWILKLIKEVRDELCEMSPQTWRQEIVETIDVDILSQVLSSGTLDMDYLGKILEFALVTLEKLSAPANDEELKSSHCKLLEELREIFKVGDKSNALISFVVIKGLRNVLQEIQWLSSVHPIAEQEWDEHIDSLTALESNIESSQVLLPTTLRTGGSISMVSKIGSSATGSNQPECKGERVDKLVRLGLLKLVSGIGGLTPEALPETLKLNISRLRAVQSQFQKIIVISTSLLILHQILLSEKLVSNALDMENLASECMKQLYELLDRVEDVGIAEIVVKISGLLKGKGLVFDAEKLQAKEKLMENMLGKSLQAGDPIFARVSRSIYLALRGVVFGGTGHKGRELAAAALQRVGVALLADMVVEAAEVLIVVATVSCMVHRSWYEKLLNNV